MLQEILNIALFQLDLVWENSSANRAKMDDFLSRLNPSTDLVMLPEMFSTGFSMNVAELAETMDGETIGWMRKRSSEHQIAILGSLIVGEGNSYFNRLIFVEPSGEIQFYDKRHLFTMGGEEKEFCKGSKRLIVNYKGWRICPLICYDLRFPVWSRNRNEYDLLIYTANWPEARKEVWNTLLKARAIENQCFVAGVNRVGCDGNSICYSGNSQIISPKGSILSAPENENEEILYAEISHQELLKFRKNFPVLDDADDFILK
jgi:predicted amidohydrolase